MVEPHRSKDGHMESGRDASRRHPSPKAVAACQMGGRLSLQASRSAVPSRPDGLLPTAHSAV